jgi:hypothetical protein
MYILKSTLTKLADDKWYGVDHPESVRNHHRWANAQPGLIKSSRNFIDENTTELTLVFETKSLCDSFIANREKNPDWQLIKEHHRTHNQKHVEITIQ